MRVRVADAGADGVVLGAGTVSLVNLFDWVFRRIGAETRLFEAVGLALSGWLFRLGYLAGKRFGTVILCAIAVVAALSIWRRTRPLARIVVAAVVAGAAAWLAALACAFAYLFAPLAGVACALAAIVLALVLARRPACSAAALMSVAWGVAAGTF